MCVPSQVSVQRYFSNPRGDFGNQWTENVSELTLLALRRLFGPRQDPQPHANWNHREVPDVGGLSHRHQPLKSNSFTEWALSTELHVSHSESTTVLYFASNGFRVAAVRSINCRAICSLLSATWTQTSSNVSGICPNRSWMGANLAASGLPVFPSRRMAKSERGG